MVTKYGCGYIARFDLLHMYASATGYNCACILCVVLVCVLLTYFHYNCLCEIQVLIMIGSTHHTCQQCWVGDVCRYHLYFKPLNFLSYSDKYCNYSYSLEGVKSETLLLIRILYFLQEFEQR